MSETYTIEQILEAYHRQVKLMNDPILLYSAWMKANALGVERFISGMFGRLREINEEAK